MDLVAAGFLSGIEGTVDTLEQRVGRVLFAAPIGSTNAAGNLMPGNLTACHLRPQLFSQFLNCQRMIADQHQEFLAAPADALPIITQLLPDNGGKALEHRITGIMAELVIDLLEMIDIKQQNGKILIRLTRSGYRCGQQLIEFTPVPATCQCIQ